METLPPDCLLHIINFIKQDEDKNLTLMYWSWANNNYHNLIKPLIEIDEVVLIGFGIGSFSNIDDILLNRYHPFYTKKYRSTGCVVKIDPMFYRNKSIVIEENNYGMYGECVDEYLIHDVKQYYENILEKIDKQKDNIDKETLCKLMKEYRYIKNNY